KDSGSFILRSLVSTQPLFCRLASLKATTNSRIASLMAAASLFRSSDFRASTPHMGKQEDRKPKENMQSSTIQTFKIAPISSYLWLEFPKPFAWSTEAESKMLTHFRGFAPSLRSNARRNAFASEKPTEAAMVSIVRFGTDRRRFASLIRSVSTNSAGVLLNTL